MYIIFYIKEAIDFNLPPMTSDNGSCDTERSESTSPNGKPEINENER